MSAAPLISVVIPTYTRRESVAKALQALSNQTLPPRHYQVIVSIDGSEDGTRELVAGFDAPYALRMHWQRNQGRAAACNAGIRIATGQLVVLLDDDMEASPGFLQGHLQAHQQPHLAEQRLGVLGAVPICVDSTSSPVVAYVGDRFNRHLSRLAQPGHALTLRDFYSGNFSVRRDVLLGIGLFDEAFTIYGNEDVEVSLRLRRAGVRLVYSQEALAYQSYTKDFRGLAKDTIAKGRTAVLLVRKHPEAFRDSKLSSYAQGSWSWRAARRALLTASRMWPSTTDVLYSLVSVMERRGAPDLQRYYALTLDYCFWLGVYSVLREDKMDLAMLEKVVAA